MRERRVVVVEHCCVFSVSLTQISLYNDYKGEMIISCKTLFKYYKYKRVYLVYINIKSSLILHLYTDSLIPATRSNFINKPHLVNCDV